MKNFLDAANSFPMWLSVVPVVVAVLSEAFIFTKKAKEAGPLVGLDEKEAKRAFKVGATAAIGPSLGVFIVMLGLMAAIGAPLSWQRLSIIGAAPTELAAANMAAKAQDVTLGAENYGLINYANATWVMALNGGAWLFTSGLFTDKLDKISNKVTGGDTKKLGILSVTAMCGAFGYFAVNEFIKGLAPDNHANIAAVVASALSMGLLTEIGKKYPKLNEFNLGISMIIGMIAAIIVK